MADARVWPDRKLIVGFLVLPKPGIVALVVVSTFTGLYVGGHGLPPGHIAFWTLLGMGLATAGAAALNNFIDRDIDSIMRRTSGRSVPSGSVSASAAYMAGTGLVMVALVLLKIFVSGLVTVLTGAAVFIYVVLYSMFLKRRTPLATHIGGIAGAMPPLIGYAAAHGELDMQAVILFLIIVVWQQPHFWSLALKYREDYARANVPILPVAKGVEITKQRILLYVLLHFPVMWLPYHYQMAGVYYFATAMTLSALYLAATVKFVFSAQGKEMTIFHLSNSYLMIVFAAMMADAIR
ncbi:MAG: protoheme IX farnesyltransferase [Nitrospinae bacterium]|nr:protoheme IX farnesyltransferase [Nitrospinota bacterium]